MSCARCSKPTVGKSKYCREHRATARQKFKEMIAKKQDDQRRAKAEITNIFKGAWEAGKKAAAECVPTPMVVQEHENPLDDTSPVVKEYPPVMGGVCGFASVIIKPGNSKAAYYAKKNFNAHKHYYGGVAIPIREYNQSYEKKTAHAIAMANSLKEHGIKAHVWSRLD